MRHLRTCLGIVAACALSSALGPVSAASAPAVRFDDVLCDFVGPVRVSEARVAFDPENHEVFVGEARDVHVFNRMGMEVFHFEIAMYLGAIRDLAVLPSGDILALAYDLNAAADHPAFVIARHDYRGTPRDAVSVGVLPEEFAGIRPNRMVLEREHLFLASTQQLLALEIGLDGSFVRGWNLGKILEIPEKDRETIELSGFGVDRSGNLLVTSAVLFHAFRVSPDGTVSGWGKAGGTTGSFGNVAGIACDGAGRYYVVDKLRRAILVFDESFQFLTEFGNDPTQPGQLVLPSEVFYDGVGRLYVTQVARVGVWSYTLGAP